jgi:hypothetical protein
VAIGQKEAPVSWLKRKALAKRLSHHDRGGFAWEDEFRSFIEGGKPPPPTPRESARAAPSAQIPAELYEYLKAKKIEFEDRRARGGAFWIFHVDSGPQLAQSLTRLGFKFKPGRGWWRAD